MQHSQIVCLMQKVTFFKAKFEVLVFIPLSNSSLFRTAWSIKKDNSNLYQSFFLVYHKVGKAITLWGAIERSPILLLHNLKNDQKIFCILGAPVLFLPHLACSPFVYHLVYSLTNYSVYFVFLLD